MFPSLYKQTVHYSPQQGDVDLRGIKTFAPAVPIKCRLEGTTRLIRTNDGEQVAASYVIFCGARNLSETGLFFPPGTDPTKPETGQQALNISEHFHLLTGKFSHTVIYL